MSDFETKDSGQRAQFDSGMVRDTNEGKARFELLFPLDIPYEEQMLTRFAELMARGAAKYSERNFEQASGRAELNRFRESGMRHMVQWLCGDRTEDHGAAVMFNILGAEMVRWKMENAQS